MARDAVILMRANPPLEEVSFFPCNFQGPPLPVALVMDLPELKSLRRTPIKQQVHLFKRINRTRHVKS
jgi:hypothetical protein